ncbi:MAG: hypothetical protein IKS28_03815 [Clostridia bacterium]|nr:hypothetical protein [Clostridia bacterium]
MQSVKRITAILFCILLVVLSAACGQTEPTATETQPAESQTSETTASSAPAVETQAVSETTTASQVAAATLMPTKADLDTLLDILHGEAFFGTNYDCRTDNVLDYLYNNGLLFELFNMEKLGLLKENETLFRVYSDDDSTVDPLGHFKNTYYIRIKADVLNDYMENTFNNTVYKEHSTAYADDGTVLYYLHDGWYYFSWEVSGMEGILNEVDSYVEQDGHLIVTIKEYQVDPGDDDYKEHIITLSVDAVLREVNGTHAWSIYSIKNVYRKY